MGWNIFIYGTLKKGEPNHWLIKKLRNHARFLSQAQTKEKLPLVIDKDDHNLPKLLNKPGIGKFIIGQVYVVDQKGIEILDKFENPDTDSDYQKVRIDVILLNKFLTSHTGDQDKIDCYCYMVPSSQELENLDYIEEYKSSGDHGLSYSKEAIDNDLEHGSELIAQVIGDDRLLHVTRRDFTDDSSDRQNSSETQTD